MLRVAAHIEAFHECGACVGAAAGKGLTAMRELVFGVADVRQNEGLQRAHELMETILPGLLLQLVEQDVHTADGCAGIRLGWIPGGSHRLVGGAPRRSRTDLLGGFPVKQAKNSEFLLSDAVKPKDGPKKPFNLLGFFHKFPRQHIRELKEPYQGSIFR